jgi:hypothetical protein
MDNGHGPPPGFYKRNHPRIPLWNIIMVIISIIILICMIHGASK